MAWIKFHTPEVQRYHSDEFMPEDYWIEDISREGVAQVKDAVAEQIVKNEIADYHTTE